MPMEKNQASPFSKVLYNKGIKPVIIEKRRDKLIVIHPRKTMRLGNKRADELLKKEKELIEEKDFIKAIEETETKKSKKG